MAATKYLIVCTAGAALAALVGCSSSGTANVDKQSYEAGYNDAFGGAYLPTDSRDRDAIAVDCESLFRGLRGMYGSKEIVLKDWVTGCVDVAQNKDSRFK
ncbi:hypothetical protein ABZS53_14745 [Streptomyces sp. NPDC005499]|uniref:hypothetical protein n=1 Tax=Streptomyces sp. NPDC005499 TaxID=3154883 RepID=UPI0033A44006